MRDFRKPPKGKATRAMRPGVRPDQPVRGKGARQTLRCVCGASQTFIGANREAVNLAVGRSGWLPHTKAEGLCPACRKEKGNDSCP